MIHVAPVIAVIVSLSRGLGMGTRRKTRSALIVWVFCRHALTRKSIGRELPRSLVHAVNGINSSGGCFLAPLYLPRAASGHESMVSCVPVLLVFRYYIGKLAITLGPCLSLILGHVPDSCVCETRLLFLDHGLIVSRMNAYLRLFVSYPRVPILPRH